MLCLAESQIFNFGVRHSDLHPQVQRELKHNWGQHPATIYWNCEKSGHRPTLNLNYIRPKN